jgi:putative transcriptional regulator
MSPLAPGLLVAAPPLGDPHFERSVVLLASHGEEGAFGWVVNGRRVMSLTDLLAHVGLQPFAPPLGHVQVGGPVGREQVWLLYKSEERFTELPDQIEVGNGIMASPSQKVLEALANVPAPPSLRGVLGFAGWAPSQLETEISRGAWLPTSAEPSLVFDVEPDVMWAQAYQRVGMSPMAFTARIVGQA